jgi:hypothetical protein
MSRCAGPSAVLDALMQKAFGERLADFLPGRALPVTTKPLDDFDVLVDRQYTQIADLLTKGKRRRPQARSMIRGLLAMEAHAAEDTRVSERDVNRVERNIRDGKQVDEVFPRLHTLTTVVGGQAPSVTVHFTKKGGMPVTYTQADDPHAAAVREVDLHKKFHWPANELSTKLTSPRRRAPRSAGTSASTKTTPAATCSRSAPSATSATPTTPTRACARPLTPASTWPRSGQHGPKRRPRRR